jgi:hypothetical protein
MMVVEKILATNAEADKIFLPDSFEQIMFQITFEALPRVGCEAHCIQFMTEIIYDYMLLSYKCIAKRQKMALCDNKNTKKHTNGKLMKTI